MQELVRRIIKGIQEVDEDLIQLPEELEATAPAYYISTQTPTLDLAIGKPGIPSGRVTLLYGGEGHGKSTVAYHLLAEAQRIGGVAVLLDTEYAFDLERAKRIGIRPDDLILIHPPTVEESFVVVERVVREVRAVDPHVPLVVVWDSLAATPAKTEIDKKDYFYDLQPGQQARVLSSSLRKMIRLLATTHVVFVLVNQVRENVGVFYGPKEIMPGGRAIKFYASLIIRVRREGFVEEDGRRVGIYCVAEVEKNKLAPPFRTANFIITFDRGIDRVANLLEAAILCGLVTKNGGWLAGVGDLASLNGGKRFREKDWEGLLTAEVEEVIRRHLWEKGGFRSEG